MKKNEWTPWLKNEWEQPYFKTLASFVHQEYENGPVYPPKQLVFSAFENCDLPDVKVVILGQDPYHQRGQAHGMCFSVNPGVQILHPGHTKALLSLFNFRRKHRGPAHRTCSASCGTYKEKNRQS